MFLRFSKEVKTTTLIVYVDDILLIGDDRYVWNWSYVKRVCKGIWDEIFGSSNIFLRYGNGTSKD